MTMDAHRKVRSQVSRRGVVNVKISSAHQTFRFSHFLGSGWACHHLEKCCLRQFCLSIVVPPSLCQHLLSEFHDPRKRDNFDKCSDANGDKSLLAPTNYKWFCSPSDASRCLLCWIFYPKWLGLSAWGIEKSERLSCRAQLAARRRTPTIWGPRVSDFSGRQLSSDAAIPFAEKNCIGLTSS